MSVLSVTEWLELFEDGEIEVVNTLLRNLGGLPPKFNAENHLQVLNMITACKLHEMRKKDDG